MGGTEILIIELENTQKEKAMLMRGIASLQ